MKIRLKEGLKDEILGYLIIGFILFLVIAWMTGGFGLIIKPDKTDFTDDTNTCDVSDPGVPFSC